MQVSNLPYSVHFSGSLRSDYRAARNALWELADVVNKPETQITRIGSKGVETGEAYIEKDELKLHVSVVNKQSGFQIEIGQFLGTLITRWKGYVIQAFLPSDLSPARMEPVKLTKSNRGWGGSDIVNIHLDPMSHPSDRLILDALIKIKNALQ